METNIKPGDMITPAATDGLGQGLFIVLSVYRKFNSWNQYVGTSFLVQDLKSGKNWWARSTGAKLVQSHA